MKKFAVIVLALLLLCVATLAGLDQWGGARLRAYESEWRGKIPAMREADARRRMPVLRGGAPGEENAAALERELLARVVVPKPVSTSAGTSWSYLGRSPFAPLLAEEAEGLEASRAIVEDLARAVRCTRCDWAHEYEKGYSMAWPRLLESRRVSELTLAAGHERARAGDLRGAADRYLDAARFGADIGRGFLGVSMGPYIQDRALRLLGALATDAPSGTSAPLEEIDGALRALEPALPDAAEICRIGAYFDGSRAMSFDEDSVKYSMLQVVLARAVVAHALPTLDSINERVAAAAALPERAARDRALSEAEAEANASNNWLVPAAVSGDSRVVEDLIAVRSRFAVTRLALAVERRRLVEGKAPATLEEKDLPVDPSAAPARLHYQATSGGAGYRIWSVGANGKDEQGAEYLNDTDDVLAERKAPGAA